MKRVFIWDTLYLNHKFLVFLALGWNWWDIDADPGDPIEAPPGPYKVHPTWSSRSTDMTDRSSRYREVHNSPTSWTIERLVIWINSKDIKLILRLWLLLNGLLQRNPYIPLDVPNPTMAQENQRKFTGLKERKQIQWPHAKIMHHICAYNQDF